MTFSMRHATWRLLGVCIATALAAPAVSEDNGAMPLPDIDVIGVSPLMGAGTPSDEVPYRVQVADPEALATDVRKTVYDFFEEELAGASAVDVQNNPYQQNFSYRGFVAGPLLGESVGIAVFQNGVRVNEPFGDVVQSDLFPEMAIERLELGNANPAFGFNALGGALALRTHTGKTFQGAEAVQSVGSFGRSRTTLRVGREQESVNAFLAFQHDREDGWRDASPSTLNRLFADVGSESERGSLHLNLSFADNDLIGNGLAPTELSDVSYTANFTTPDQTQNRNFLLSGQGNMFVNDRVSVQGNLYWRRLDRQTLNGDEIDAEDCEIDDDDLDELVDALGDAGLLGAGGAGASGFICGGDDDDDEEEGGELAHDDDDEDEEEELAVIIDQDGHALASFDTESGVYGAMNTSTTETSSFGGGLQASIDSPLSGMDNQLVIGAGVDIGRTEFHSESEVGSLLISRAVTRGPGSKRRYNVGLFEVEFEDDDDDDHDDDDHNGHANHDDDDDDDDHNGHAAHDDDDDDDDGEEGVEHSAVAPVALVAENRYLRAYLSDSLRLNDNLTLTGSLSADYAEIVLTDESDRLRRSPDGAEREPRLLQPQPGDRGDVLGSGARFAGHAVRRLPPEQPGAVSGRAVVRRPGRSVQPSQRLRRRPAARTGRLAHVRGRSARHSVGSAGNGPFNSLDWSVSAYHATNSDDIIFIGSGVGLSSGFFDNVEETRRQGFDVSLRGRGDWIDWYANYGYVEATFQSSFEVFAENHPYAVGSHIRSSRATISPASRRIRWASASISSRWTVCASVRAWSTARASTSAATRATCSIRRTAIRWSTSMRATGSASGSRFSAASRTCSTTSTRHSGCSAKPATKCRLPSFRAASPTPGSFPPASPSPPSSASASS